MLVFLISLFISWRATRVIFSFVGGGETWAALVFEALYDLVLWIGLLLLIRRWQIDASRLFGLPPALRQLRNAALLAIPLVVLSYGLFYLVHLPLSLVAPRITEWALALELLIEEDGSFPIGANLFNLLLGVVVAPFLEEVLFRGFLFRRWTRKWGWLRAAILSSVLFGSLHFTSALSATAFGLVACILYARSGSLWLPILTHGVNNLLAYAIIWSEVALGGGQTTTLAELQRWWWIGLLCLAIGVPWFIGYLRREWPDRSWRFPPVALGTS